MLVQIVGRILGFIAHLALALLFAVVGVVLIVIGIILQAIGFCIRTLARIFDPSHKRGWGP